MIKALRDSLEIGDYVELDEEVATIETDKVQSFDAYSYRALHCL